MTGQVDLKRRAGTPFDQIVDKGRTLNGTGGGTSPKTFAELLKNAEVRGPRCRCGSPATVNLQVTARALGGETKRAKAIASTTVKLCEPCAVQFYEAAR